MRVSAPVPLSINMTKMDILAMDVVDFFIKLIKKYRIPPRYLEIEVAENAYLNAMDSVREIEEKLRAEGFRVVMDGFDGDFIVLKVPNKINADAIKVSTCSRIWQADRMLVRWRMCLHRPGR